MHLNLFFDSGEYISESKGLREISNELGLNISHLKLPELKIELLKHPAFRTITKLELLAKEFNIKNFLFGPL